ncbi:trehalose-phosphatase [Thioclava sp. JE_KL1]|uniref:trehalose-phosphatase n=1 Tax=Thioclava sp. JE_KL1 TaxID=2651187 RepID=UPI00128B977B|nr:trehalose-phosphatase [Thioclava sp. JE_KL1]MPQ94366.1 trehalose-phosphatase [Thioclava sp. JE_KL1]
MAMDDMTGKKPAPPALDPSRDALFLDFDGCLVDIAPRPDAVIVPQNLPRLLEQLSEALNGALAVVSGRSLHELERFLDGFDGLMVGSHGSEARGMEPPMAETPQHLGAVKEDLAGFAQDHDLIFEDKSHGAAIHFRSNPAKQGKVEAFTEELTARYDGFTIQPAKMAVEIRPEGFSKDGALAILSDLVQFGGRNPVYAGDDTTDEPALAWAEAHGGFGIKVGDGESVARYHLDEPMDVRAWLAAAMAR